jgi:hypothetical protein
MIQIKNNNYLLVMPLTIRDIKKDLKRWCVLRECYGQYEENIPDEDRLWRCTINDYLVQIWINMKMEIDNTKVSDILKLIPKEQEWLKKQYIKMLCGQPVFQFEKLVNALRDVEKPSDLEKKYLFEHYPVGHRSIPCNS